jgi:maltose alpha-D-glucosyltransferase / alpha-amylase
MGVRAYITERLAMPTSSSPEDPFLEVLKGNLPSALPEFLAKQRWFGAKARTISSVEVSDVIPFHSDSRRSYFILAHVKYTSGPVETYDIPLVQAPDGAAQLDYSSLLRIRPRSVAEMIVLKDALTDESFLAHLLDAIASGMSLRGARGIARAVSTPALQSLWQPPQGSLTPSVMNAEQSNSSVVYGKRLVLKIFRRLEEGLNPDLEIGSFLTGRTSFRNVPPLAGYLEYVSESGTRTALGMLQGYVANQGDAWQFSLKALAEYYERAQFSGMLNEMPHAPLLKLCDQELPNDARQRIGPYLDAAALLGRRTAELHLALGSDPEDPDFAPQPFSETDLRAFANSALQLLTANFDLLRRLRNGMPDHFRQDAESILKLEDTAGRRFQLLTRLKISATVTRIHGDYHLGQVLFTGNDFVIIDFEGEPARPLAERRQKRSPLQDVAGMLRSFHYAAYAPLLQQQGSESLTEEQLQVLGHYAQYWQKWVSAAFLKTYLEVSGDANFIPIDREELALLLDLYLLDKAVYELGYELNNRPSWVRIPLDGISQLLQSAISN